MAGEMRPPRVDWEPWEDEVIRSAYPDYRLMEQKLPHRNYRGLRYRAGRLKVVTVRHHWTPPERKRLRDAFRNDATNDDLLVMFPDMSFAQIKGMAQFIKAPRRYVRATLVKDPALLSIRKRTRALGITFRQLDKLARSRNYFGNTPQQPVIKHIVKAIEVLGGNAKIVWSE